MREPGYPPAWYPDPRDPQRLRRWDGRAWTHDTRPPPAWVRSVSLSPGPGGGPKRRTSRALWAGSVAVLAGALLLMAALGTSGGGGPDRLSDQAFARQAAAACRATEDTVVAVNPPTGSGGPAEGRRVEALANGFAVMVERMREADLAPADRPAVDRWLGAWDSYIALGFRRADALQRGDLAEAARANDEAAGPKQAINRFAGVNRLDACLF